MPRFARLLVIALSALLSLGAAAKEPLRVGIYSKYPPLAYHDNEGLSGIEVAVAGVIGQNLDRKVKFVEMDFDKLIPALEAGEIDIIMSGMTITPARSERVLFSNSYLDAGQMAIIRFADAGRFGFKGALFRPGARVGVQKHTTGEDYANQNLKNAQVTHFDSIDEGLALLKSSRIDFVVHDAATSWSLPTDKNNQDLMSLNHALTDEHLGWAVKKDNQALLNTINQQLDLMQKNGMLRAIIRKWIPVTVEVQDNIVNMKAATPTSANSAKRQTNSSSERKTLNGKP